MDLRFKAPFTAIIAGPTSCGKSHFVNRFLKYLKNMCDTNFNRVVWYYDEWQPLYQKSAENIEYKQGLPEMSDFNGFEPVLIILDDLMRETGGVVVDIFTKCSHHRNLSVFYITQNLFHHGKGQRDISLNANYSIYFKNPRDKAQINHLARQIFPENVKFIQEAYNDATSRPYGYLLFDLTQSTPNIYRFRTNILPDVEPSVVYTPKKGGDQKTASIPLIVKYLPENIVKRKTLRLTDFFQNEFLFYEKVWPALKNFQNSNNIQDEFDNLPELLSGYIDGENDYIAMLDLSYEDYVSFNRNTLLNYEYTISILQLLASFHALSLALKDQQPKVFEEAAFTLKESFFAEKYRPWYGRFQESLVPIVRNCVEKELPPLYLEKFNKLIENDLFGQLCTLCQNRGPLSVIAHGDVWITNFLGKYDPSDQLKLQKVAMIDFQLARYTSLATDLTSFFYACVDFDLLENKWNDLIEVYHKALVENLEKFGSKKDLVSLEALHNEIRNNGVFGIGMSMDNVIMLLREDTELIDLDEIQGSDAVPLESVWVLYPFQEQEKRRRIAKMIKHAVDNNFI